MSVRYLDRGRRDRRDRHHGRRAAPAPTSKATIDVQAGMGRQRVDAFFKALASGDPDAFEAMAKEHYTPEMLARRTPADRKQMVERFEATSGR